MSTEREVAVEDRDGVAVITIDRPERNNALTPAGMKHLRHALIDARDDDAVRVIVVTGRGERAFCAGTDLGAVDLDGWEPSGHWSVTDEAIERSSYYRALNFRSLGLWKPVIAAVNGHCLGGGLEIALQCDIRVASENATFGLPEARWGSLPAAGGIHLLLQAVPRAFALQALYTADPFDAYQALEMGLVTACVAQEDLMDHALGIAARIAANAPLSVQATKRLAIEDRELGLEQALLLDELTWNVLRTTRDRQEGQAAFREKRRADFRGE
jgi:enoyl-CoA hydratase/carnithine racemase